VSATLNRAGDPRDLGDSARRIALRCRAASFGAWNGPPLAREAWALPRPAGRLGLGLGSREDLEPGEITPRSPTENPEDPQLGVLVVDRMRDPSGLYDPRCWASYVMFREERSDPKRAGNPSVRSVSGSPLWQPRFGHDWGNRIARCNRPRAQLAGSRDHERSVRWTK
jgi:hypothetical protein